MIRPANAPMNTESMDHLRVSAKVMQAQVNAPAEAHKFVTHNAITDWKVKLSVVPASNASQEPQIMIMAIICEYELPGLCNAM